MTGSVDQYHPAQSGDCPIRTANGRGRLIPRVDGLIKPVSSSNQVEEIVLHFNVSSFYRNYLRLWCLTKFAKISFCLVSICVLLGYFLASRLIPWSRDLLASHLGIFT